MLWPDGSSWGNLEQAEVSEGGLGLARADQGWLELARDMGLLGIAAASKGRSVLLGLAEAS